MDTVLLLSVGSFPESRLPRLEGQPVSLTVLLPLGTPRTAEPARPFPEGLSGLPLALTVTVLGRSGSDLGEQREGGIRSGHWKGPYPNPTASRHSRKRKGHVVCAREGEAGVYIRVSSAGAASGLGRVAGCPALVVSPPVVKCVILKPLRELEGGNSEQR